MCGNRAYSWNTYPTRRDSGGRWTRRSESKSVVVAERDPAGARPHRARDRPQHRRLARAGRADEGDGLALADVERYVEREVAKRNGDVESEDRHRRISLSERRTTALMTTSSAPMARATLKSTASSS